MAWTMKVQNIVASANLYTRIPLEKVALELPDAIYNPEEFPGLILKIDPEKDPSKTALIFNSGKVVLTGSKSEEEVKESLKKLVKKLESVGIKIEKEPTYEIQNIVIAGDLGMKLNLNDLVFKLENAEYEPEQFPGLSFKLYPDKSINFLLFSTGKFVLTGAKNLEEAKKAIEDLIKKLKELK